MLERCYKKVNEENRASGRFREETDQVMDIEAYKADDVKKQKIRRGTASKRDGKNVSGDIQRNDGQTPPAKRRANSSDIMSERMEMEAKQRMEHIELAKKEIDVEKEMRKPDLKLRRQE